MAVLASSGIEKGVNTVHSTSYGLKCVGAHSHGLSSYLVGVRRYGRTGGRCSSWVTFRISQKLGDALSPSCVEVDTVYKGAWSVGKHQYIFLVIR